MVRRIGEHLRGPSYTGAVVAAAADKLGLPIPAPLLGLLGLRKGQRLRVRIAAGKVTLTVRRVANSPARGLLGKHSGAERVRLEAKWNRLVLSLKKTRGGRRL